MAIIYSYPTIQPTVYDLIIGTDVNDDNATKSFTVQSLVSLINAAAGSGTVTSIDIVTDEFLIASGGPVIDAGVITLGLTATGTPSATTFLRGDNQWVVPTVTSGISVLSQSTSPPITTDLSQLNFTGAGVVTSSGGNGSVQINIEGATNAVESVTAGAGITIPSTTGNIVVSNSGVTQVVAGTGISIDQATGTGVVTFSVTNQTSGTVTSVTPGPGLLLSSGSTTTNPAIGVNYVGTQNYILETPSTAVALPADNISFNQASSNDVKTSTLATVPMTTLPLVKAYIDAADAPNVKNNTDTYTSLASVAKVITLTDAEYTAISTKDGNTLYLTITTAATQFTKTLAITNNVSGMANGSLTLDQNGLQKTGAENSSWSFTTGVSTDSGYSYTGNAPVTISGTFDSDSTVTSTITGSITQDSIPQCTSTLTTASGVTPALQASYFTLTSGSSSTAACTDSLNASSVFPVVYALTSAGTTAGYSYTPATTTYSGNNGTYSNSPNITGTAQGTVTLNNYTYTVVVNSEGVTTSGGATYSLSTSGPVAAVNGARATGQNTSLVGSIAAGTSYTQTTNASAGANSNISNLNSTSIVTGPSTANGNVSITHTFTGSVVPSTSTMTLNPTTSFTPAAAWSSPAGQWGYSINGGTRVVGLTASGQNGLSVVWTFLPNPPTPVTGYTSTGTTIGTVTGVLGTNSTVSASATGTATANTGDASMTLANNGISGPVNGYTVSYTADGSPYTLGGTVSGTVGANVVFNTVLTVNANYTATTALSASYSNGSSVQIPGTTAVTLAGTVIANRGQGVYVSTSHISSNEACQEGTPTDTVYLSVGGSNIYAGVTCYTSATGSGVVANGYYKANNNTSWMRITGGNGVVQSTGSC